MKKRTMLLLTVILLLLALPALGESWATEDERGRSEFEDFGSQPPQELRALLNTTCFADDPVIDGAISRFYSRQNGREEYLFSTALLAVQHGDSRVLIRATDNTAFTATTVDQLRNRRWYILELSDHFLREGEDVEITIPRSVAGQYFNPSVVYGQESFTPDASRYERVDTQGNGLAILYAEGQASAYAVQGGTLGRELVRVKLNWPNKLEAFSADEMPATAEELKAFAQTHRLAEDDNAWYVAEAALRQEPGRQGKLVERCFPAPAEYLGETQKDGGTWYHLRLGNTEGWMDSASAGTKAANPYICMRYGKEARTVSILRDTTFYFAPGSDQTQPLPAGTLLRAVGETDGGYYHVVYSNQAFLWPIDANGVFGYVKKDEAALYDTPMLAKYGIR